MRAMGVLIIALFRIFGLFQRASLKLVFIIFGARALVLMLYFSYCWVIILVAMITPALLME